jgi:hypothetical protein
MNTRICKGNRVDVPKFWGIHAMESADTSILGSSLGRMSLPIQVSPCLGSIVFNRRCSQIEALDGTETVPKRVDFGFELGISEHANQRWSISIERADDGFFKSSLIALIKMI